MLAMCPGCGGKGCAKCNQTGRIGVRMAQGKLYTPACTSLTCGFENGGRISQTDMVGSAGPCVLCDAPTVWKFVTNV